MGLSNDLISQFVKITNDDKKTTKETVVYGEVTKIQNGRPIEVKLDGSQSFYDEEGKLVPQLTPVSSTVKAEVGNRVIVTIKNHIAVITGNLGSPAVIQENVDSVEKTANDAASMANNASELAEEAMNKVEEFDTVLARKVSTDEFYAAVGRIEDLEVKSADVDEINANIVKIKQKLTANEGDFFDLTGDYVTVEEQLNANAADIEELKANKLSANEADIKYAKIEDLTSDYAKIADLEAVEADIESLQTDKLSAKEADVKFANIDFSNIGEAAIKKVLADSGLIENIVVGDGTITGKLVGVTISGDLIEGNTVVAEKLVIKGSDGLYYKLNTDGMTTEAEQTDYNSLNGSVIKAKSITATKISVDDLVAFDATIGGFNISESSLYSGAKSSVDNTTSGIYLDREGQMAIGDSNNFIKYYKDSSGNYKLAISAASIIFASTNKSVETAINEVKTTVDNINVGGRNLLLNTGGNELVVMRNGAVVSTSGTITSFNNSNGELTLEYSSTGGEVYYRFMAPDKSTTNLYGLEPGQSYTLSGKAKVITTSGTLTRFTTRMQNYIPNSGWYGEQQTNITLEDTADWINFAATFTVNASATGCYTSVQLYFSGSWVGTIKLKNLKLEKGNIATDWTQAPEDLPTSEDVAKAQTSADNAQADIDNLSVGGRNLILNSKSLSGSNIGGSSVISDETYDDFVVRQHDVSEATSGYVDLLSFSGIYPEKLGEEYTFSFYAKGTGTMRTFFHGASGYIQIVKAVQSNGIVRNTAIADGNTEWALSDTWTRYWVTWTLANSGNISIEKYILFRLFYGGSVQICGVKLEKGNKATDWTPAPEDMATSEEVNKAQTSADEASTKASNAETLIAQLKDSISMLVTDGNGTSLMTQTEDGWTFSTADIQDKVNTVSENLEALTTEVGDTNQTIDILQQAVEDLGVIAEYVKITTYEDEPCIELGEGDSEFKLRITNTRMMFTEGSNVLAYFNNQSLHIKKAVVEEELQQGGFVWKARSNGNVGVVWKGGTS